MSPSLKIFNVGAVGAWTDMGVAITSAPYAVPASTSQRSATTQGIITVFFTVSGGAIASTTTSDDGHTWSALTTWPGTAAAGTGPAAVVNPATQAFDVFYVDSASHNLMDDHLAVNIIPPASAIVTSFGGYVTATPAVVSPVNGFTDVVVRGTGGHIWEQTFETGDWSTWTEFHDGTIGYGAAMVNPGRANVTLFVAGSDNRLYKLQSTDNGVSWHTGSHNNLAWTNLGGFLTSQPSASLYTDHAPSSLSAPLKVAVAGTNSNVWQWSSPPGAWSTASIARP